MALLRKIRRAKQSAGREIALALPSLSTTLPRFTFETFVLGESNRLAYLAAKAVADGSPHRYNPLVIYGDVGLGKTHLLHAIGNQVKVASPAKRICCCTSEYFTRELIDSLRHNRMERFRARFRSPDILLFDAADFLAGTACSQGELIHTFDELLGNSRQIVVTLTHLPWEIAGMDNHLSSRLAGGVCVKILPPDRETRLAIVRQIAVTEGFPIPDDVAEFLAAEITGSIREFIGGMIRINAAASMLNQEISVEFAHQILRDISGFPATHSLEEIE